MKTVSGKKFLQFIKEHCRDTISTSWELIKITVPVLIVTRILEGFGMISSLSGLLEPVMGLIGLPGELGLVWATAMLTSLYGGMAVFAALAPGLELTVAQVTVLCSAMLIAHSLPIELSISKRAGAPLLPIAALRLFGAIIYCWILDLFCRCFSIWQQPVELFFSETPEHLTTLQWMYQQTMNMTMIIVIIFAILLAMRILKLIGVLDLLERLLAPVLPHFGMGKDAAPVTVVGMVLGLGYGGALIIRETSAGKMEKKEIFHSLAMMALCHGLVEDTLAMVVMGGKLGGILWGRILFSLIVIFLMVRIDDFRQGRIACSQV